MARKRLGERLLDDGIISREQLAEALHIQKSAGSRLGEALLRLGHLRESDLIRALAQDANIPFLLLEETNLSRDVLATVPESLARAHTALPLEDSEGRLTVALANPFDLDAVAALERASGRMVSVVAAPRQRIAALVDQWYQRPANGDLSLTAAVAATRDYNDAAPDLRIVDSSTFMDQEVDVEGGTAAEVVDEILLRGVNMGATDIHIEPARDGVRLRFRVDGVLRDGRSYPSEVQSSLIARLKILAGLNIAESRLPQDGRFRFNGAIGRDIDLRISTYPTMFGEDIVLRVLDRSRVELSLATLGMLPEDIRLFQQILQRPHGMIPVTGPTGSGKTTTLYAALHELNNGERCILTLEDPIEYEMDGVRQGQIDHRAGLTFASGLRALLRHDPDVILVGEMRDDETVRIGVSAALTGHLVLTTLHTNTAAGAIPRLMDMGVEPFLIASSIQLIVAQRLLRALCPKCKTPADIPAAIRQRFNLGNAVVYGPSGCRDCRSTGFRGRVGIFELVPMTPEISTAIYERRSAEQIQKLTGRPTLLQNGLRRVMDGVTSLDEVFRAAAV